MSISDYDAEELAAKLCELGDEYDSDAVEQALFDKYEISFDKFHNLICDLAPMCAVGQTVFGGKMSRGFADVESQCFIARVDA
jgi:hypothetical protein